MLKNGCNHLGVAGRCCSRLIHFSLQVCCCVAPYLFLRLLAQCCFVEQDTCFVFLHLSSGTVTPTWWFGMLGFEPLVLVEGRLEKPPPSPPSPAPNHQLGGSRFPPRRPATRRRPPPQTRPPRASRPAREASRAPPAPSRRLPPRPAERPSRRGTCFAQVGMVGLKGTPKGTEIFLPKKQNLYIVSLLRVCVCHLRLCLCPSLSLSVFVF